MDPERWRSIEDQNFR